MHLHLHRRPLHPLHVHPHRPPVLRYLLLLPLNRMRLCRLVPLLECHIGLPRAG